MSMSRHGSRRASWILDLFRAPCCRTRANFVEWTAFGRAERDVNVAVEAQYAITAVHSPIDALKAEFWMARWSRAACLPAIRDVAGRSRCTDQTTIDHRATNAMSAARSSRDP